MPRTPARRSASPSTTTTATAAIDIFVANDSMRQFLFRNRGDGTFTEVAVAAGVAFDEDGRTFAGMGTDFGDYDGDGRPDLIVTTLSLERYALFRNDGPDGFTYTTHVSGVGRATARGSGWGTRFFDYDNDGDLDLFVAQGHVLDTVSMARQGYDYEQPPLLLRNDDGRFTDVSRRDGRGVSGGRGGPRRGRWRSRQRRRPRRGGQQSRRRARRAAQRRSAGTVAASSACAERGRTATASAPSSS